MATEPACPIAPTRVTGTPSTRSCVVKVGALAGKSVTTPKTIVMGCSTKWNTKRDDIARGVEARLEDVLRGPDDVWQADYVRLRFTMTKPAPE